jgi:endonuclease/exonuclease/phosphatase family metal-dependent hydrolase
MRAIVLTLLAGCGGFVGADQPWVPADSVTGVLAAEQVPPPTVAAPVDTLRVVTYNLEGGGDVAAIAAAITSDPDLANAGLYQLQEEESYPEEGSSRASRLAAQLGLGYAFVPGRTVGDGVHGLALMSPYPITNVEKMDLPDVGTGLHRIAIQADLVVGTHTLHVIDLHLETFIEAEQRIAQLHPVVIDAPDQVFVSGDFNTSWVEWSHDVPVLTAGTVSDQAPVIDSYMAALAFEEPSVHSGPTEHMFGLLSRLDSFYPRGLGVTFGDVERVGPSDHWPMWIDVELP